MSNASNHLYIQAQSCRLQRLPHAPCSLCICQFKHEGRKRIVIPLGPFQRTLLEILLYVVTGNHQQIICQVWCRWISASTKEVTMLFSKVWKGTRKSTIATQLRKMTALLMGVRPSLLVLIQRQRLLLAHFVCACQSEPECNLNSTLWQVIINTLQKKQDAYSSFRRLACSTFMVYVTQCQLVPLHFKPLKYFSKAVFF